MQNFAKDTGDFTSISLVDTQVIALGIKMARQKNQGHLLRREPQPLTEFRPKNFDDDYKRKYDEAHSSEEEDSDNSEDQSKQSKKAVDSDEEWSV